VFVSDISSKNAHGLFCNTIDKTVNQQAKVQKIGMAALVFDSLKLPSFRYFCRNIYDD